MKFGYLKLALLASTMIPASMIKAGGEISPIKECTACIVTTFEGLNGIISDVSNLHIKSAGPVKNIPYFLPKFDEVINRIEKDVLALIMNHIQATEQTGDAKVAQVLKKQQAFISNNIIGNLKAIKQVFEGHIRRPKPNNALALATALKPINTRLNSVTELQRVENELEEIRVLLNELGETDAAQIVVQIKVKIQELKKEAARDLTPKEKAEQTSKAYTVCQVLVTGLK